MSLWKDLRLQWRIRRARTVLTVPIFHIGRCGSTVLNKMLQQHPKVRADSEIYPMIYARALEKQPDLHPRDFTRDRVTRMTRASPRNGRYIYEMKFFSDLDLTHFPMGLAGYSDFLTELGVRQGIVLKRRNHLRRVVSTRIAVARGQYQKSASGSAEDLPRVSLDPDAVLLGQPHEIVTLFDMIEDQYARLHHWLGERGIAALDIVYEDHIEADPKVAYAMACEFMGLRPAPVEVPLARINTAPLHEVLSNFDEVAARLTGTPYAWMLET